MSSCVILAFLVSPVLALWLAGRAQTFALREATRQCSGYW